MTFPGPQLILYSPKPWVHNRVHKGKCHAQTQRIDGAAGAAIA
jgi:hypothetical protein